MHWLFANVPSTRLTGSPSREQQHSLLDRRKSHVSHGRTWAARCGRTSRQLIAEPDLQHSVFWGFEISSWPGLSRPSTSFSIIGAEDVDARDKPWHDQSNAEPDFCRYFSVSLSKHLEI